MKNFITGLFLCLSVLCANAEGHLLFKGVEINGSPTAFVDQMKAKGLILVENFTNGIQMKGSFMGILDCEFYMYYTPKSHQMSKVCVYLPSETSWSSIKSQYTRAKESYTAKYGEPRSDYHFFSSPYYEGDGYEMTAVKLEKCNYAAFWDATGGNICIEISKFKQVEITYEDDANMDKAKAEREASVQEEI